MELVAIEKCSDAVPHSYSPWRSRVSGHVRTMGCCLASPALAERAPISTVTYCRWSKRAVPGTDIEIRSRRLASSFWLCRSRMVFLGLQSVPFSFARSFGHCLSVAAPAKQRQSITRMRSSIGMRSAWPYTWRPAGSGCSLGARGQLTVNRYTRCTQWSRCWPTAQA
jgi:hypothetical protein